MLKGIPSILSPELLKILMEMGHGDSLVIGDGNFPGASMGPRLIRLDGPGTPEVLEAIRTLFPLDRYIEAPVKLMEVVPGDQVETPIWDIYRSITDKHAQGTRIGHAERFAFYDLARSAYCVIQTGESALYANIWLQKGVVTA